MTRLRWFLSLALVLALALVWLASEMRLAAWLFGDPPIAVQVAPVTRRALPATVRISGMLAPAKAVDVISQLAGKITEIRFKVGDAVPAGAVVATIFPVEIAERENQLGADLGAAHKEAQAQESQLAAAEKLAARTRELFAQDLIARRDMEQAELAAQTARAQAELARAHLAQQEAMLAQAQKIKGLRQITAPISGVIARRLVEPGALIAPSRPILTIAYDGRLKFTGRVADENAGKLRVGLTASVVAAALPEQKLEGTLTDLESGREHGAAVIDVEIEITDAPTTLHSAIAAQALVVLDPIAAVLMAPRAAIVESGGKNYLFKFVDSRAIRVEVQLGPAEGDDVVIQQGIGETDLVIVDKVRSVQPGARVRASITAPASIR